MDRMIAIVFLLVVLSGCSVQYGSEVDSEIEYFQEEPEFRLSEEQESEKQE